MRASPEHVLEAQAIYARDPKNAVSEKDATNVNTTAYCIRGTSRPCHWRELLFYRLRLPRSLMNGLRVPEDNRKKIAYFSPAMVDAPL